MRMCSHAGIAKHGLDGNINFFLSPGFYVKGRHIFMVDFYQNKYGTVTVWLPQVHSMEEFVFFSVAVFVLFVLLSWAICFPYVQPHML